MNPKTKTIVLIAAVLLITTLSIATAAVVLTSPEHIQITPLDPTPTPTTQPTPTPSTTVTEVHLTSNYTIGTPFYKGDTVRMTAQLDKPISGVSVSLFNGVNLVADNGTPVIDVTDVNGIVVFDRKPVNPTDYTVKATLP